MWRHCRGYPVVAQADHRRSGRRCWRRRCSCAARPQRCAAPARACWRWTWVVAWALRWTRVWAHCDCARARQRTALKRWMMPTSSCRRCSWWWPSRWTRCWRLRWRRRLRPRLGRRSRSCRAASSWTATACTRAGRRSSSCSGGRRQRTAAPWWTDLWLAAAA
eukprot:XP_001702052.1 predicted protein [Chlamydomonas reinhardtii]